MFTLKTPQNLQNPSKKPQNLQTPPKTHPKNLKNPKKTQKPLKPPQNLKIIQTSQKKIDPDYLGK